MVAARKLTTEISVNPSEMSLTVDKASFKKVLAAFNRIADRKSCLPVLANMLIKVEHDTTTLAATDLNLTLTHKAPWLGRTIGCTSVKAKALADMIGKMPNGEVTLARDGRGLSVMSGSARFTLDTIHAQDYPKVPSPGDATFTMIDAGAFVALLKSTDHSICQDETRFHLNGTLLEADGRTMRAVSTDGHRLTRATAPIKGFTLAKGVILPRKASRELAKLLAKGECEIAVVGPHMFVKQGAWTLAAKLIDAQFPPYEQVIPKENRKLVTVEREPLLAAIERAKLVSTETRGVKLSCDDGQLRIQSDNPDTGETSEWLPAEHHGATIVIGFNAKYLLESLNELEGERVTLGIGAALDPILVRATDDVVTNSVEASPFVSVVMPMRL
jgi:DNA polymerase-3 subunit beta